MKKHYLITISLLIQLFITTKIYTEDSLTVLEFRNQKTVDVLYSLAAYYKTNIVLDETIQGTVTFNFNDSNFESALIRFCDYFQLFYKEENGVYYISKIFVQRNNEDLKLVTISADDVNPLVLIKRLSKEIGITIMTDSFPSKNISIKVNNETVENVLLLFSSRYEGYEVSFENGGYFIRNRYSEVTKKDGYKFLVNEDQGVFDIYITKASFQVVVSNILAKGKKEYLFLTKNNVVLENIKFNKKSLNDILQLICNLSNIDYVIKNETYYFFDIAQKDITKQFKDTIVLSLNNITCDEVLALIPSELNYNSYLKANKKDNSFYITGSKTETESIIQFIEKLDIPLKDKYYEKYTLNNISVTQALQLLPKNYSFEEPFQIPETTSFIALVNNVKKEEITNFLKKIDVKDETYVINLKYIKSEELLKYLPPKFDKTKITLTPDSNVVFFTGNKNQYDDFRQHLKILDKRSYQIRYELLVVQMQKSTNSNYSLGVSLTNEKTQENPTSIIANLSSLYNVNFDIVSMFGLQAAINLNMELSENRAKVLADTTLNGISGNDISFENKNIFRYRDIITDASNKTTYSSIVREISTGLSIKVNGWVSGDEMITVNVSADLSKQGSSTSSSNSTDVALPSTSEKTITTNVRTKSGVPIIISGLIQLENEESKNEIPIINKFPILRHLLGSKKKANSTTELVIYLTPFVEKDESLSFSENANIRSLYEKYVKEMWLDY